MVAPDTRHIRQVVSPLSGCRYSVVKRLGQGGFGTVFQVKRNGGRGAILRQVCLKITRHSPAWHREAYFGQLLAGHPRAIQAYESFPLVLGPRKRPHILFCLVLELAPHGSLADRLSHGPLSWSEARIQREVRGLLGALDYLHRGRALHRDVTPFNVFVCEGELLKLGDFGIARHGPGPKGLAPTAFNPGRAPPGILESKNHRWREADDVYQVGPAARRPRSSCRRPSDLHARCPVAPLQQRPHGGDPPRDRASRGALPGCRRDDRSDHTSS
jgi:serine/threonine-protein kinase